MRQTGKTTRLIDEAIQHFFEHGEITILSPSEIEKIKRIPWRGLNFIEQERRKRLLKFVDPDYDTANRAQELFVRRFENRLLAEHGPCFKKNGPTYKLVKK